MLSSQHDGAGFSSPFNSERVPLFGKRLPTVTERLAARVSICSSLVFQSKVYLIGTVEVKPDFSRPRKHFVY